MTTPTEQEHTCRSCPFWDPVPNELAGTSLAPQRGFCRKNAPRPQSSRSRGWSQTKTEDWCGDHPGHAAIAAQLFGYYMQPTVEAPSPFPGLFTAKGGKAHD